MKAAFETEIMNGGDHGCEGKLLAYIEATIGGLDVCGVYTLVVKGVRYELCVSDILTALRATGHVK